MFELKSLSKDAIRAALAKAQRYRLLNEPAEAESICLDVLAVEPDYQEALVTLLLALTDQFDHGPAQALPHARELLPRLVDPYEQAYYAGIICERQAKSQLAHDRPGSGFRAYEWFREAMGWYAKAEAIRPPGNDDALLRWNTCARFMMRNPHLAEGPEERAETLLE